MAAPRYIDIDLDKPRKLRFDVNALDDLERALGEPLGRMIALIGQGSIRSLRLAVLFGLKHEDKNLTADRVGNLIQDWFDSGRELGDLNDLVIDAIYASGVVRRPEEAPAPDPTAKTEAAT